MLQNSYSVRLSQPLFTANCWEEVTSPERPCTSMFCPVIFLCRHILSCPVLSSLHLFALPCPALPCPVLSCPVPSVLSCTAQRNHFIPQAVTHLTLVDPDPLCLSLSFLISTLSLGHRRVRDLRCHRESSCGAEEPPS
jgi:hypothetical protein